MHSISNLKSVSSQFYSVFQKKRKGARRLCISSKEAGSGIITGHCIVGTHERHIGLGHLANVLCRRCEDDEEGDTILHLLCICLPFGRRVKRHLGAYYIQDLDKLSCMDIGSLSRFIGSSEVFLE